MKQNMHKKTFQDVVMTVCVILLARLEVMLVPKAAHVFELIEYSVGVRRLIDSLVSLG